MGSVTERIYRSNPYESKIKSRVEEVFHSEGKDVLVLDKTVFFPTGGGQPCDRGTVSLMRDGEKKIFSIVDVYDHSLEGDVFHVTDAPEGTFAPGDQVETELDWDRRFTHMQRHLGEHLFTGSLYRLFGWKNKGFHMGEDYTTIDMEVTHSPEVDKMIREGELEVNRVIWMDVPVHVDYFPDKEAASVMPVRKPITAHGMISVVTAGDREDPLDCCACCGTHADSTGQVGLVKVYKAEANKGMTRIYFDSGKPALMKMRQEMDLLRQITDRFSAGDDDIISKLDIQEQKEGNLRKRYASLRDKVMETEKEKILSVMKDEDRDTFDFPYECLEAGDLVKLGFAVMNERGEDKDCGAVKLLTLTDESSHTVLLFSSGEVSCGKLVKEKAGAFGGRGGGRDDNARAVFPDMKSARMFIREISG